MGHPETEKPPRHLELESARDWLENGLRIELAGSARLHALADAAALRLAHHELIGADIALKQRTDSSRRMLVAASKVAAIEETVRGWRMSPDAAEYVPLFEMETSDASTTDSTTAWGRYYYAACIAVSRPNGGIDAYKATALALETLCTDLAAINLAKSENPPSETILP